MLVVVRRRYLLRCGVVLVAVVVVVVVVAVVLVVLVVLMEVLVLVLLLVLVVVEVSCHASKSKTSGFRGCRGLTASGCPPLPELLKGWGAAHRCSRKCCNQQQHFLSNSPVLYFGRGADVLQQPRQSCCT